MAEADGRRAMLVAGLQLDIAWEDPAENFRRVEELAAEAVELLEEGTAAPPELRGSEDPDGGAGGGGDAASPSDRPRVLVLPEMFATGFSMDSGKMAGFAEQTREFLATFAIRHRVHVVGGYAEPAEPLPANACSIFDPGGEEILHFRKLHPFALAGEDQHYTAGDSVETVAIQGIRVTPFICYDLRFPEPFRAAAKDTDLFLVMANWPHKRIDAWITLLRARAMENQAYVLGVNRAGEGDGLLYPGDSALFGPLGEDLALGGPRPGAAAGAGPQGVIWGEVDPRQVTLVRRGLGFLRDRKPELYRRLEEARQNTLL